MECDAKALDELVAGVKPLVRGEVTLEIEAFLFFQEIRCAEQKPWHMTSEQSSLGLPAGFGRTPASVQ